MLNRTTLKELGQKFAKELRRYEMIKSKDQSPEGKGFRIHRHETDPSAPLSPYYIDLRNLRSHPTSIKVTAVSLFEEMIKGYKYDRLADVPTAITPIVSSLSDRLKIPMISPRITQKGHGTGLLIEGFYRQGDIVLPFDDLVTKGASMVRAVRALRAKELHVGSAFVLIDREEGAKDRLAEEGVTLHSALTITELFSYLLEMGTITKPLYDEIEIYRHATT